jgi:hypothetical protein
MEVWNTAGTHLIKTVSGLEGSGWPLAALSAGSMVAVRRADEAVLIDLDSGGILGAIPMYQPDSGHAAMAFMPDGTRLVIGASDGRLTEWAMTEDTWLRAVSSRVGRLLTPAERRLYVDTA